ncbi:hypothetical protein M758_UG056800 [Ceratodon purpureus]|nr:hypothetical protein M758_UG056800 [Ceratodon purpureus]
MEIPIDIMDVGVMSFMEALHARLEGICNGVAASHSTPSASDSAHGDSSSAALKSLSSAALFAHLVIIEMVKALALAKGKSDNDRGPGGVDTNSSRDTTPSARASRSSTSPVSSGLVLDKAVNVEAEQLHAKMSSLCVHSLPLQIRHRAVDRDSLELRTHQPSVTLFCCMARHGPPRRYKELHVVHHNQLCRRLIEGVWVLLLLRRLPRHL